MLQTTLRKYINNTNTYKSDSYQNQIYNRCCLQQRYKSS